MDDLNTDLQIVFANYCVVCSYFGRSVQALSSTRMRAMKVGSFIIISLRVSITGFCNHEAHIVQACKLAPDIGHLSGKFEVLTGEMLSLTGHVDWALQL